MKEVRVALIGTGVISHQHMQRYADIPNAKVVAACDIDKKKLEAWGGKYQIKDLYTDFREMLKRDDIDAVDVCLHNNLHMPMALEVLKSGKHCYCEKPMAASYADAKLLYTLAKKSGKELSIHLDMMFLPQSRVARRMVENGDLGHVYHARSVGLRRRMRPGLDVPPPMFSRDFITKKWAGHGALYDMGVYHISQLLYILGTPKLERVTGHTYQEVAYIDGPASDAGMEVEELGVGFATYENGLTLDVIESWAIHMDEFGPAFLVGSKGGLKLTQETVFGRDEPNLKFLTASGFADMDIDLKTGSNAMMEGFIDPKSRFLANDQACWIAYLSGELEERYDTAWLALQTMLVSEGIFLSSELGREIKADEIAELSKSTAIRVQETVWGTFRYDF
ncbi:MAG: Gfo/Idh/MocA family protein [Acutalibacter sp.]